MLVTLWLQDELILNRINGFSYMQVHQHYNSLKFIIALDFCGRLVVSWKFPLTEVFGPGVVNLFCYLVRNKNNIDRWICSFYKLLYHTSSAWVCYRFPISAQRSHCSVRIHGVLASRGNVELYKHLDIWCSLECLERLCCSLDPSEGCWKFSNCV